MAKAWALVKAVYSTIYICIIGCRLFRYTTLSECYIYKLLLWIVADVEPSFGRLCSLIMAFGGLLFVLDTPWTRGADAAKMRSPTAVRALGGCPVPAPDPQHFQSSSSLRDRMMIELRAPEGVLLPGSVTAERERPLFSRMCRDDFQRQRT